MPVGVAKKKKPPEPERHEHMRITAVKSSLNKPYFFWLKSIAVGASQMLGMRAEQLHCIRG